MRKTQNSTIIIIGSESSKELLLKSTYYFERFKCKTFPLLLAPFLTHSLTISLYFYIDHGWEIWTTEFIQTFDIQVRYI